MKAGLPGCGGANLYLGTGSLRRENLAGVLNAS
jgi:hypothetical protein